MKFPLFTPRPLTASDTLRLPLFQALRPRLATEDGTTTCSINAPRRSMRPGPVKLVAALLLMVFIAFLVLAESLCGAT